MRNILKNEDGYCLLLLLFLVAATFGGALLYIVFISDDDSIVMPFNLSSLYSSNKNERREDIIYPITEEEPPEIKKYKIEYFDIDAAENKSLVNPGNIDLLKKETIEKIITQNNFKSSHINSYSVVFVEPGLFKDTSKVVGIFRDGKQIPIVTLEEINGFAHSGFRYLVVSSLVDGHDLELLYLHELGHTVGDFLTNEEFKEFMEVRRMSNDVVNSWYKFLKDESADFLPHEIYEWDRNPKEDFAEIFMYYFKSKELEEVTIRTVYGQPTQKQLDWFERVIVPKIVENT